MRAAGIFMLAVMSGIIQPTKSDCDGQPVQNKYPQSDKLIRSPNFPSNEKGRSADCIWDLNPPLDDGKNYFLKFEILNMRLYYVNGAKEKICPNYILTVHGKQMNCTLEVNYIYGKSVCMTFYNSEACEREAENECSESPASKTSFPIRVTYASDGSKNFEGHIVGFKARYEFKECPEEQEPSTTTSTSVSASSVPELDQRESTIKDGWFAPTSSIAKEPTVTGTTRVTSAITIDNTDDTEAESHGAITEPTVTGTTRVTSAITIDNTDDTEAESHGAITDPTASSTSTIIIALIAVIVFLLVGGIIGGICFYRRLQTPANAGGQRQQPISQNIPTNAIPDVAFHNYEEIQSPVQIETPGNEVPQPIGMPEEDEESYVVPNVFQQGESSREGEYAEAFQHLKPEPDYIEPETVRKEPNRRLVTKLEIPQKPCDLLPTTSDGYLAFGKKN